MSFIKKTALCLLAPAALGALAGCQQDTASTKKTGTYAAARRTGVGSNIPQRQAVDSTGSTMDQDQFQNLQQQQSTLGGRTFTGGTR